MLPRIVRNYIIRLDTLEILSYVDAATADVSGYQGIGAKRPGPGRYGTTGRDDALRRHALFDPVFMRRERVE